MSASRNRINRAAAERLLACGAAGEQHRRLAALLASVAAPTTGLAKKPAGGATAAGAVEVVAATAAEAAGASITGGGGVPAISAVDHALLPGEAAAMAAFRVAQRKSSRNRRHSVIAKLLTLKVAMGTATAMAAGGIAFAASNGTLPNPLAEQAAPQASAAAENADRDHGKQGSPAPSLVGLCKAYGAKVGATEEGKALDSPAFQALVTAAGAKDKVTSYCENLLASAKPKHGEAPADRPSGAPTDHPSKPDTADTPRDPAAPTDRPSGAPTDRPTR
ncbi:MAG TPA: hypothetical protein VHJ83_13005 [Micromonosporaceae bacterium]|nr:hypothetical protein [Micromonosporaceae bacterium]